MNDNNCENFLQRNKTSTNYTCTCWSSCSVILARSIETRSDTMDAKKVSNFEVLFHTRAYSCVTTGAKTGLKVSSWWLKVHFKKYTAVYSLFFVLTLVSPHTLIFFATSYFSSNAQAMRAWTARATAKRAQKMSFLSPTHLCFGSFMSHAPV